MALVSMFEQRFKALVPATHLIRANRIQGHSSIANLGDPMKIKTGQIVQVRYSMRHQFDDGKDDLYFVYKQEPVGTRGATMTYLRNTRTGSSLNICSAENLFIPLAPIPCP